MAAAALYSNAEIREEARKREEKLYKQIQEMSVGGTGGKKVKCDNCMRGESRETVPDENPWYERVALFLCFLCRMYVCAKCLPKHEWHKGMTVGRKKSERQEREGNESDEMKEQGEREKMRRQYILKLMNESEKERTEQFFKSHVSICDRIDGKHRLDRHDDCHITGFCGLENKKLVVCDWGNSCMKIFKLGSHVIQRYIRFVEYPPWDATEITLKQNFMDQNLVPSTTSDISVRKPCLIAVTLPKKFRIMVIDLSKKPAETKKLIKTEKLCMDIQFCDDKIFIICEENGLFVYIKSTNGETLNNFNINELCRFSVAVVSGRVCLINIAMNKIQRRNLEGEVISEIEIEESPPLGMSIDPDNNVYIHAGHRVYKLDPDLTQYKSVLDQNAGYIGRSMGLCYYRDKLFICGEEHVIAVRML